MKKIILIEKRSNGLGTLTIILLIGLLIISFLGGAAFWFYQKGTKFANSAANINTSSNPETPSSTNSAIPDLIMPTADVEGQDLSDVARYPGSVRSGFYRSDDGNFIAIDYFTKEKSEKIIDFYKKELISWNILSENQKVLTLAKESREATIEIMDEDKVNSLTQYSISYTIIKME